MAYREVSVVEIREVLRRWLLGQGYRAIARDGLADRKSGTRETASATRTRARARRQHHTAPLRRRLRCLGVAAGRTARRGHTCTNS